MEQPITGAGETVMPTNAWPPTTIIIRALIACDCRRGESTTTLVMADWLNVQAGDTLLTKIRHNTFNNLVLAGGLIQQAGTGATNGVGNGDVAISPGASI